MKTMSIILKIVGALATVAAIAFIVVRYGDQIVAWTRKTLSNLGCRCFQERAEEIVMEDEVSTNDSAPVQEDAVHAEETDFEG